MLSHSKFTHVNVPPNKIYDYRKLVLCVKGKSGLNSLPYIIHTDVDLEITVKRFVKCIVSQIQALVRERERER